ncbi:MAG: DUF512 domain-containing protein [FCB group bacterium]|nr:DUF512 domain-containing protein [FCB group bacterium]
MRIISVEDNCLGAELGLQPGDRLLKINGTRVRDVLDYRFRFTEKNLSIEVEMAGKRQVFDIEKDYDDLLGVEFEDLKVRSCANNCVFCFVDQNPPDMRKTLYFRDGDYRLSYLHGHYITMTNMGQNDLQRIVDQRLSPLYISVHVTDRELRQKLFLYGKDDHLLEKIKFLTDHQIELHTQIVLIPHVNDGDYLQKTLDDLYGFSPLLKSVSIVPVGLTGHRRGLMELSSVTPEYAVMMTDLLSGLQNRYPVDGSHFLFLSDEWYILAGLPFPPEEFYQPYDLVENGVGQVSHFLAKFEKEKDELPVSLDIDTEFTIITGRLVNDVFQREIGTYLNKIQNLKVNIIPIDNDFMGRSVTVTGLLTGRDIVAQLTGRQLGQAVWCTKRIINDEGTRTLDDMTLEDMSAQLGVPFLVSDDSIAEIFERSIVG